MDKDVTYNSVALWPDEVSTGKIPNESRDTHPTQLHAEAVCDGLKEHGWGMRKTVFPINTEIEKVYPPGYEEVTVACDMIEEEGDMLEAAELRSLNSLHSRNWKMMGSQAKLIARVPVEFEAAHSAR